MKKREETKEKADPRCILSSSVIRSIAVSINVIMEIRKKTREKGEERENKKRKELTPKSRWVPDAS